jgi:hypothetical protein
MALVAMLTALTGCGAPIFTTIDTTASAGTVSGRVVLAAGTPVSGVYVSATPPPLDTSGTVPTGADGRFTIGVQPGAVTLTATSPATTTATVSTTGQSNVNVPVGLIVVAAAGTPQKGNVAPTVTASLGATSAANGAAVTITANVTDPDTPAADLQVVAAAAAPDGTLLGLAILPSGASGFSGSMTVTNTTGKPVTATVTVSVSDPLSNTTVVANAGTVTIGA